MKTALAFLALASIATSALAAGPDAVNNLDHALSSARHEQKMAFLLLGRPTCSICNGTKKLIHDGKIAVTADTYVMADLNVDDSRVYDEFMRKFKGQNFGNTLPFVVVTNSSGKLMASSGGYKNAEQWNALLRDAGTKAAAVTPAGAADSFSVFKSIPAAR